MVVILACPKNPHFLHGEETVYLRLQKTPFKTQAAIEGFWCLATADIHGPRSIRDSGLATADRSMKFLGLFWVGERLQPPANDVQMSIRSAMLKPHLPAQRPDNAPCYLPWCGQAKAARRIGCPFCGKFPQLWCSVSSVCRIRWVPDQSLSHSHAQVDHIDVLRYADGHGNGSGT